MTECFWSLVFFRGLFPLLDWLVRRGATTGNVHDFHVQEMGWGNPFTVLTHRDDAPTGDANG